MTRDIKVPKGLPTDRPLSHMPFLVPKYPATFAQLTRGGSDRQGRAGPSKNGSKAILCEISAGLVIGRERLAVKDW